MFIEWLMNCCANKNTIQIRRDNGGLERGEDSLAHRRLGVGLGQDGPRHESLWKM